MIKENKTLEFKETISNSFLKTVSAFSNFNGGTIMFGVSDDGKEVGVEDTKQSCLDIENKINDNISPKPDYSLAIDRKTNVVILNVHEGEYKPYLYKGKAYRRSDTATIAVDQIEMKRLTLAGSHLYFEGLVSGKQDLTFNTLIEAIKRATGDDQLNEETLLISLGLYTKDKGYNIAGALLADQNSFPGVDIVRFGRSINEFLDRKRLIGMSVIEQYNESIEFFKRYYESEIIVGKERKLVEKIPESAFREAIANALVHRTWDVSSHIRVSMFDDHVEVTSPGGLYGKMTEEEFLNGQFSNLRNPILGYVFFRLNYIEIFGTGIRRIKDLYNSSYRKPEFIVTENTITVSLPTLKDNHHLSVDGKKVLDLLQSHMIFSSNEIAERLSWSRSKAIRVLKDLVNNSYVEKIGNGRGTKYLLK